MSKRIYISGPMTGHPDLNFLAFYSAAKKLARAGYEPVNPVEINPDPTTPWHQCMRRDIAELMSCDGIYLLPGWEKSQGAQLELHIAHRVGIDVLHLNAS